MYNCCPTPTPVCPIPNIAGTWTLTLTQIVRNFGGPNVTCANVVQVTNSQQFQVLFVQCPSPNTAIVTATIQSGPAIVNLPFNVGDQLLGVFKKQGNDTWILSLVSPATNVTIDINFITSRKFGYSYTKPVNDASSDYSAVGFGNGTKL